MVRLILIFHWLNDQEMRQPLCMANLSIENGHVHMVTDYNHTGKIHVNSYNLLTWIKAIQGDDFQGCRSEVLLIYPDPVSRWSPPTGATEHHDGFFQSLITVLEGSMAGFHQVFGKCSEMSRSACPMEILSGNVKSSGNVKLGVELVKLVLQRTCLSNHQTPFWIKAICNPIFVIFNSPSMVPV